MAKIGYPYSDFVTYVRICKDHSTGYEDQHNILKQCIM